MPIETAFLPAERSLPSEIHAQAGEIDDSSLLAEMLDTAPGMVMLLNANRQIVFCNDACATVGGLPNKQAALGMRPGELLHCIHATDMPGGCGTSESCRHCGLAQSLVSGQKGLANSGECLLQCQDLTGDVPAEYSVEIRPLARFGGDMVSCSISDISDVKRREALEHIFFHDIMNRAAAVQGASNLLADEEILPETRSMVTGMLSACSHALVDEIQSQRTLLAAEKGELAVQMTACDSLEALRAAVVACESLGCAERKQVTVLPDSLPVVFRTDVTLLGRILINLLKNALESADTGTTVTVSCSLYGLDRVRFSIHNDIFMPDRIRAHVFQRSFSTKGAGRGLGTYSVKLLTERYLGGHTWFDSTSKGTTFHVEFDAKTSGFPLVA